MGGFNPGGFLNLGAPEVIVIGAVAWVLLGPKELFRLSREAGKFLGEWQQLGQQAKDQFQTALETELNEDEMAKATASATAVTDAFKPPSPPSPTAALDEFEERALSELADMPPAPDVSSSSLADLIPPLSEYTAAREAEDQQAALSDAEKEAAREALYQSLGDPEANAATFAEQISGARNEAVLAEYPAELTAEDAPPADGSPIDVQSSSELLLANQIAEAENQLETLKAEKSILAMKRQQLEANAARAARMAEEKAAAAEAEVAKLEAEAEEDEAEQEEAKAASKDA